MDPQNCSPEIHYVSPTTHVPNSRLPVLVYRNVLPRPHHQPSARAALEKNDWIQGGVFKHYPTHHYHTVTHECYAVFKGKTRYLVGKGPLDKAVKGIEFDLEAGDLVIQPAGVAHCNLQSSDDFEYIGVYPKVRLIYVRIPIYFKRSCLIAHRPPRSPSAANTSYRV